MPSTRSQPQKIGVYTVLAKLGEGAASVLYAVQHPKTKQVSALKFVEKTDEKSQRFLDQVEQEYAIGSKLQHDSIRKIKKLVKHRKLLKITGVSMIMELVDATTLDQELPKNHTRLSIFSYRLPVDLPTFIREDLCMRISNQITS